MVYVILTALCLLYLFIFIWLPVLKTVEILTDERRSVLEKVVLILVAAVILVTGFFGMLFTFCMRAPQFG